MYKKTTLGIALILIVILFTAGTVAGALMLQSSTRIHDNTVDGENIVISSTTYTDFLDSVAFDTANADGNVTYTLRLDSDLDSDSVNDSALISNALSIRVDSTNVTGTFNLTVTVDNFVPVSGLTYTMVVGGETAVYASGWTFSNLALDSDLAVALYVSGTPAVNPGATVGFTNYDGSASPVVAGSVFTFTAIAPNA